jgi:SAM-dependent methyltransferase
LDYKKQADFFLRYRILAVYVIVVILATSGWSVLSDHSADRASRVIASVFCGALGGCLYYVPLYLGLSVDTRKRAAWNVRVRWIAIPATLVIALTRVASAQAAFVVGEAAVVLLAANYAARLVVKRATPESIDFAPVVELVADLVVLALLVPYEASGVFVGLGFAFAGSLFAFSTTGATRIVGAVLTIAVAFVRLGAFRIGDAVVGGEGFPIVAAPLVAIAGALVLAVVVDRQNTENVETTVADLAEFAGVTRETASELLASSTSHLARTWNENPPTEDADVSRWYSENSKHYLYDLAQFHLAYKHIAFMLDVVRLAKGRVLDHGAGIGDISLELSRRGNSVTYVDVPGETQGFARWRAERESLPLVFGRSLDEAFGPFDTIISLDVLEHIRDPIPVVDALVDRLAPGGTFVVTAYFGPTKAHPMHFDHDLDLAKYLREKGLRDEKGIALRYFRSEIMRKPGVLVFAK